MPKLAILPEIAKGFLRGRQLNVVNAIPLTQCGLLLFAAQCSSINCVDNLALCAMLQCRTTEAADIVGVVAVTTKASL